MRLFVAVWPPAPVVEALAALPRPERPGLRWTSPEAWHVTLRFLGPADPDEVAAALAELALPAGAVPVAAELGPGVGRFGHRVLHVPVTGLGALAGAVVGVTAGVGRPPDRRPFSGHITLARNRGRSSLAGLTGTPVGGRWLVEEATLVASVASGGGGPNRYEVMGVVPVDGGP